MTFRSQSSHITEQQLFQIFIDMTAIEINQIVHAVTYRDLHQKQTMKENTWMELINSFFKADQSNCKYHVISWLHNI